MGSLLVKVERKSYSPPGYHRRQQCLSRALTKKQSQMFPEAVGILDIFHVMEHLWPCVYHFEAENTPEAARLFEKQLRAILEGRIGRVVGAFRQMAKKRKLTRDAIAKLEEHLGYFENNRQRMCYDEYGSSEKI